MLAFTFLVGFVFPAAAATDARVNESYGKLPLQFEANRGQTDKDVRFLSRGPGYNLYLTANEAVLVLSKPNPDAKRDARSTQAQRGAKAQEKSVALRMSLVGAARQPLVSALEEQAGKANYFIGKDPAKWRTNIPTYGKVHYRDVYPGIDLVYYGNQRQLEYDFVVAPGADPKKIVLGFKGSDKLEIDAEGNLVLRAAGGDIRQHKPVIYQEIDGIRREIAGSYVRRGANRVGFKVAAYDSSRPLVIDPTLSYSTYLGGGGNDIARGVAADIDGNAYVTGQTTSLDFPTTSGAFQPVLAGSFDAFVAKLNPSGSGLVYSTYLGGNGLDWGNGIAVDAYGNVYVTGISGSTDFPTTPGAFQPAEGGGFVTKLDATGSSLVYSTYLGGGAQAAGIAVDAQGNAYMTGQVSSATFPTTPGAFQPVFGGGPVDAFVMKLNADGSALVYSTYLGGSKVDFGNGIAVDTGGNAYVAGSADSIDFPTTPGAFRAVPGGGFVTKLDPTGSSLVYSTYLNAPSAAIAVDAQENAYVTGTAGTDFPTTPGAFQPVLAGSFDAFVAKLNPPGSELVYSTYLGGTNEDHGNAIAVNAAGNAYVTGYTSSNNFPTTPDAVQPALAGAEDVFVTILNTAGSAPVYSTYLGGAIGDAGQGIAVDAASNAYVTGGTRSSNFPTTPGAFQPLFRGGGSPGSSDGDAFVAKFVDIVFPPPPTPSGTGTTRSEESAATQIGFWTSYGAETGTFSGGSIVASNVAASTAMFSFTGTAVSWIGVKCNVCGIAAVSIDGGAPTTVNTTGPNAPGSLSSEPVFSASGLAPGSHTMIITVTGMSSSGGSYVAVDAFDVTGGSRSSPLLPPVVLPPPPVVVPPLLPIVGL
jgi:hypothetical protein